MPSSGSESEMAEPTDMNGPTVPLLSGDGRVDEIVRVSAEGETENTDLSAVVVDSGAVDEIDEITPAPSTYGATDPVDSDKKKDKDGKKKKDKSGQKAVADALKTDMAAERTFFKWLWTGLHTGAIGSFIFIAFDGDKEDPMRLVVVGFSWVVALALVLYGTFAYYRRRHALRTGDIAVIPTFTREHSPLIVVVALSLVVGTALLYAWLSTGFSPQRAQSAAGAAFGAG